MNNGIVVITGQSEAVKNAQALELKRQTEMTDAFGNTVQVPPHLHVGFRETIPGLDRLQMGVTMQGQGTSHSRLG